MTKYILLAALSSLAASAWAIDLSGRDGAYRLSEDRYGMCTDRITFSSDTASSVTSVYVGSWNFARVDGNASVHDDSSYRSETRSFSRGNKITKVRSVYDKGNRTTATQKTVMTLGRDSFRIVDRDVDVPATTIDCTYVKIRN